jgi:hypothetical protein
MDWFSEIVKKQSGHPDPIQGFGVKLIRVKQSSRFYFKASKQLESSVVVQAFFDTGQSYDFKNIFSEKIGGFDSTCSYLGRKKMILTFLKAPIFV